MSKYWHCSYDNKVTWTEIKDRTAIKALDTAAALREKFINDQSSAVLQPQFQVVYDKRARTNGPPST